MACEHIGMSGANPKSNIWPGFANTPHEPCADGVARIMKRTNTAREISAGVVHELPRDMERVLVSDRPALEQWEDLTPLARNEWICWVEDAKKAETRQRRIERLQNDLKDGKRRPCCWPGCRHRERNGR